MPLSQLVLFFFLPLLSGSDAHSLYLLPSFQGTILRNDGQHIHLAPLSPATYPKTYSLLTHPQTVASSYAEYPTVICGASSHAGHCMPLPGHGPISHLQRKHDITAIPYDWRLPSSQLIPILKRKISELSDDSILLAHGTACRLATLINPVHTKLICLSPVAPELAEEALSKGEGLLTVGDAHRYMHPGEKAVQKDFRMMEHELGLVKKKRLLPERRGPWDERDVFAAPVEERVQLAARIASLAELAKGGALGVGERSLCVQGTGVGRGCDGFDGRVVEVDVVFLDLVGLVDAALRVMVAVPSEQSCGEDELRT